MSNNFFHGRKIAFIWHILVNLAFFVLASSPMGSNGAPTSEIQSAVGVASTSIEPNVQTVVTLGYHAPWDGGGAIYHRASQEPPHQGKLQSADGAWWEITESTVVDVKNFGAKGDGVTDDAPAIQNAINYWLEKSRGSTRPAGTVFIPRGRYLLRSTLVSNSSGLRIRGASLGAISASAGNSSISVHDSILQADHNSGPALRIKQNSNIVSDLIIDSSASRRAGSGALNMGILVDADEPNGRSENVEIRRVRVAGHPSHGIALVAHSSRAILENIYIDNVGGHGVVIDRGNLTNRANKYVAGQIRVYTGVIRNCGGHAIAVGSPTDAGTGVLPSYRVEIRNVDMFQVANDPGARFSEHVVWMDGENNLVEQSGLGGDGRIGGIFVAGRTIRLVNNRYIRTDPAITIGGVQDRRTKDVFVDGMKVVADTPLDPAIVVEEGVVGVRATAKNSQNITRLMTENVPSSETHIENESEFNLAKSTFRGNLHFEQAGPSRIEFARPDFKTLSLSNGGRGILFKDLTDDENLMLVRQDGRVGIGTLLPTANLSVNGTANKPGGGSWDTFSDLRLKQIHERYGLGLDAVLAINPVVYSYKKNNSIEANSSEVHVGVVAQEIQSLFPHAIETSDSGHLLVNNDPIFWAVVNGVKDLNARVTSENTQLKEKIKTIEQRLKSLENSLRAGP